LCVERGLIERLVDHRGAAFAIMMRNRCKPAAT
jgi:hypothetical protein